METSNVFNTPPPEFNQEEVLDILSKYYNIDCSIENLVSDRDQNFKIISKGVVPPSFSSINFIP